jgi:hypothetical protein
MLASMRVPATEKSIQAVRGGVSDISAPDSTVLPKACSPERMLMDQIRRDAQKLSSFRTELRESRTHDLEVARKVRDTFNAIVIGSTIGSVFGLFTELSIPIENAVIYTVLTALVIGVALAEIDGRNLAKQLLDFIGAGDAARHR